MALRLICQKCNNSISPSTSPEYINNTGPFHYNCIHPVTSIITTAVDTYLQNLRELYHESRGDIYLFQIFNVKEDSNYPKQGLPIDLVNLDTTSYKGTETALLYCLDVWYRALHLPPPYYFESVIYLYTTDILPDVVDALKKTITEWLVSINNPSIKFRVMV